MLPVGFVDACSFIPGIRGEIRYATAHNLTGHPLAGYLAPKAILTREAAEALRTAFAEAQRLGYGMLIYDAYRPQKAVTDFVRWSEEPENHATKAEFYPGLEKERLFELGYIARRSGHSRGSTVDLTLTDAAGTPIEMGTAFDFMGEESHHGSPLVTKAAQRSREVLRGIMLRSGFRDYEGEWWHYTLAGEPYPDTYFDFDIT